MKLTSINYWRETIYMRVCRNTFQFGISSFHLGVNLLNYTDYADFKLHFFPYFVFFAIFALDFLNCI